MTALTIERPVALLVAAPVEVEPDTLVITVRQEHIDRGLRGNGQHCPIALAAKAAGLTGAYMGKRLRVNNVAYECWEATQFVRAFDYREPVSPQQLTFRREP